MSRELVAGTRVRLTARNRMHGYHPGDKGTVLREVTSTPRGTLYYLVAMDKDDLTKTGSVFTAEEIEVDE
jgi:hypothetical protein